MLSIGCAATGSPSTLADPNQPATLIRVDQFGYRPANSKVAVVADPQVGYDEQLEFEAGTRYEVRRWSDDTVVFAGPPESWSDGDVHEQSGDRGWWFDFSEVREPGSYYLVDVDNDVATGRFEIADDVYADVLATALKAFWYNRANTAHPAAFAGPWSDDAAFIGPGQDTEARSVDRPDDPTTALDLSGGWFDAGDVNKYVTFASEPVHQLLTAYQRNPAVFDDAVGIPESGNGIADVLDEVLWEIEWLERMQQDDGGVLTKVGLTDFGSIGVPSESNSPRYYEEVCSSATIAAAGMFAHAAVVFESVPELAGLSSDLRERAESAWDWFRANDLRDDCDPQAVKAGDADLSIDQQRQAEVTAAVYLAAFTGDPGYEAVVRAGFEQTYPFVDDGFGRYYPHQADALFFYRGLPGADGPTVGAIEARLATLLSRSATYGFDPEADLYRAYMPDEMYHWGSNRVKANIGTANLAVPDVPDGLERALGHLQYLHGVNPLGTVYLSNMGDLGAERSVQSLFHFWFGAGTAFDVENGSEIGVAPGYVVGGPNRSFSGSDAPPAGQPPMKSYRDSAGSGSQPMWEITEPAIYYQAAYIRLLSEVMATG